MQVKGEIDENKESEREKKGMYIGLHVIFMKRNTLFQLIPVPTFIF